MLLLAVRAIDVAIFGTLGGLWVGGAVFIIVLYRWIARFERASDTPPGAGTRPVTTSDVVATPTSTAPIGALTAAGHG